MKSRTLCEELRVMKWEERSEGTWRATANVEGLGRGKKVVPGQLP
ncbi:MAG: hypothetical protein ABGZ53_33260 [Fuerstiella sp.]